jgi:hypothetical protein
MNRAALFLVLGLGATVATSACLDPINPAYGDPAMMGAIDFPPEIASPGDSLELGVRVLDAVGRPVPGVGVSWSVQAGGGQITAVEPTTDHTGLANAIWVLGMGEEMQRARASVPRLQPVDFEVDTAPPAID